MTCFGTVSLSALLLAALAVSGCSGARQTLGLVRTSPDEFAVVAKPPLVLPPDFGLRPPVPGAPPTAAQANPVAQAATALAAPVPTPNANAAPAGRAGLTAAENALLGAAGVAATDPGIRQRVDLESAQLAEKDRGFVGRLLSFQRPPEAVDPFAEAERLRAAGQPVTTGPQPTARRSGGGLLR
ncbi:MAG: hypothetical protein RL477_140 [Pseudomonadota bacterium]|jgi:hypothetical protein